MTIKKFNMRTLWAVVVLLSFNAYMDFIELQAIHSKLESSSTLLCVQVYKIQSKLNFVLECNGVLK